jgi:hypothetical protein
MSWLWGLVPTPYLPIQRPLKGEGAMSSFFLLQETNAIAETKRINAKDLRFNDFMIVDLILYVICC